MWLNLSFFDALLVPLVAAVNVWSATEFITYSYDDQHQLTHADDANI
jgi:hypothetical protein